MSYQTSAMHYLTIAAIYTPFGQPITDPKAVHDANCFCRRTPRRSVGPCPCECNSGGFCGGCGHAGCGGRR